MKRIQNRLFVVGMLFSLLTLSCTRNNYPSGAAEPLSNEVVLKWNEVAYQAFGGTAYQHSLMAARINAMVHIAMHDALNAIFAKYAAYAFTGRDTHANHIAAAASAAHTVLLHEIPTAKSFIDSALEQSLSEVADGPAKVSGIQLGKDAAQAIITNRSNDGSAANPVVAIPVSTIPGVYQAVPPFDFQFAPFWKDIKLFGLQRNDQFRPVAPPGLNSDAYTKGYNEVLQFGKLNSSVRSADQTAFAKFWYEFSEAGWNRVARTVAVNKQLPLLETARLFALVDMAMADAYTAGWEAKVHYNFWRPYTAIRSAGSDGNDQTTEDLQWQPEQVTPPIHDYPSTHSALGNAAAAVMANLLGDNTSFVFESPSAIPAGATRGFTSFSQAAKENAESRVMAGIHFRFSCDAGLELGQKIGQWITTYHLQPLNK